MIYYMGKDKYRQQTQILFECESPNCIFEATPPDEFPKLWPIGWAHTCRMESMKDLVLSSVMVVERNAVMLPRLMDVMATPYARGFADAAESHAYNDGCYPVHGFVVLCPGTIFCASSQRQYRQGWLAGLAKLNSRGPRFGPTVQRAAVAPQHDLEPLYVTHTTRPFLSWLLSAICNLWTATSLIR
jgi:hypothetical protein